MKVLVTGGVGFIGSHVVSALIKHGDHVVVVDRNPCNIENVESIVTDCSSEEAVQFILEQKPEIAMHLAANIDARSGDAEDLIRENVGKAAVVLEACERAGTKKFIFASSCAVYGEPARLPVNENARLIANTPYGMSKKLFEERLAKSKIPNVSLRMANVYGPGQPTGVVSIFTRLMLRNQPPTLFGTGDATRDFLFVEDAAQAFIAACSKGNGAYNIGSERETSLNELVELLAQQTEFNGEAVHADAKQEIQRMNLDCAKAHRELGWKAQYSLEGGIAQTVSFEREKIGN